MGSFPGENPQSTDLHNPFEIGKQVTSISVEPGVEAEVTMQIPKAIILAN